MLARYSLDLSGESERAEEDRLGADLSDRGEKRFGAIQMVAIHNDDFGLRATNQVLGDFRLGEIDRIQTLKLHHQSQQRGDYLLTRENQHLSQIRQPKRNR